MDHQELLYLFQEAEAMLAEDADAVRQSAEND